MIEGSPLAEDAEASLRNDRLFALQNTAISQPSENPKEVASIIAL